MVVLRFSLYLFVGAVGFCKPHRSNCVFSELLHIAVRLFSLRSSCRCCSRVNGQCRRRWHCRRQCQFSSIVAVFIFVALVRAVQYCSRCLLNAALSFHNLPLRIVAFTVITFFLRRCSCPPMCMRQDRVLSLLPTISHGSTFLRGGHQV